MPETLELVLTAVAGIDRVSLPFKRRVWPATTADCGPAQSADSRTQQGTDKSSANTRVLQVVAEPRTIRPCMSTSVDRTLYDNGSEAARSLGAYLPYAEHIRTVNQIWMRDPGKSQAYT